jgi:hypothetical protein
MDWANSRTFLFAACAFLLVILLITFPRAARAQSNFASAPFFGAQIVTNGVFTNVYLFPDPDKETWDQHLASLAASVPPPDATESSEAIDAFVLALTQSSYFNTLIQYQTTCFLCNGTGIHAPAFAGDETTVQACVDAAIQGAVPGPHGKIFGYGTLRSFAACESSSGGNPSPQVNIIVSPEFDVSAFSFSNLFGTVSGGCVANRDSAFHGFGLNVPNFTVIPTNVACNPAFNNVAQSISHEMVETISDPAGFGYIHENSFGRFFGNDTAEFNQGELADICNGGPKNPKPANLAVAFVKFPSTGSYPIGLTVSTYWSNVNNSCEPPSVTLGSPTPAPSAGGLCLPLLCSFVANGPPAELVPGMALTLTSPPSGILSVPLSLGVTSNTEIIAYGGHGPATLLGGASSNATVTLDNNQDITLASCKSSQNTYTCSNNGVLGSILPGAHVLTVSAPVVWPTTGGPNTNPVSCNVSFNGTTATNCGMTSASTAFNTPFVIVAFNNLTRSGQAIPSLSFMSSSTSCATYTPNQTFTAIRGNTSFTSNVYYVNDSRVTSTTTLTLDCPTQNGGFFFITAKTSNAPISQTIFPGNPAIIYLGSPNVLGSN